MRAFFASFIFISFLSLYGCVASNDLETLQRDTNNMTKELLALQRNLYDMNGELKNLSSRIEALKNNELKNLSSRIEALKNNELKNLSSRVEDLRNKNNDLVQQMSALNAETKVKVNSFEKEIEASSQPMRRYQADLGARLDQLQMDVQNLTGRFEESKYFAQKTFSETKSLRENYQGRLDELDKKIAALNKSLEDGGRKFEGLEREIKAVEARSMEVKAAAEAKAAEGKVAEAKATKAPEETEEAKSAAPPAKVEPAKVEPAKVEPAKPQPPAKKAEVPPERRPVPAPEEAYKRAYDLYSKGEIEGARRDFKRFLEAYPKSKYAENAYFWLGECYFAEKKFDEAILEYDEVIKNYPKGNKVPDALLRQGMAFLEMNDTTNAKLIFKEVVKRFPKSDQAKRAAKKLKEIG